MLIRLCNHSGQPRSPERCTHRGVAVQLLSSTCGACTIEHIVGLTLSTPAMRAAKQAAAFTPPSAIATPPHAAPPAQPTSADAGAQPPMRTLKLTITESVSP